ncbi:hypothetical protein E2C01_023675 [Portunus trituberculatus]|uniref:Uncharacterized protein n=1 Tax=Portunus trituberculatus TaxID=210409 RepID=A0A5B7E8M4_PORTR|nr:hypothetical protein [Portunus trituberculatus]
MALPSETHMWLGWQDYSLSKPKKVFVYIKALEWDHIYLIQRLDCCLTHCVSPPNTVCAKSYDATGPMSFLLKLLETCMILVSLLALENLNLGMNLLECLCQWQDPNT